MSKRKKKYKHTPRYLDWCKKAYLHSVEPNITAKDVSDLLEASGYKAQTKSGTLKDSSAYNMSYIGYKGYKGTPFDKGFLLPLPEVFKSGMGQKSPSLPHAAPALKLLSTAIAAFKDLSMGERKIFNELLRP